MSKGCRAILLSLLTFGIAGPYADAESKPYYPGTYPSENSNPTTPAPSEPPPVVYRRVPVYPVYRAPDWASLRAAALGPWPWNFDIGGGPTVVTGSNPSLTSGSNFSVGTGYNFKPQAGFVIEFSQSWLGLTDRALQQNNAVDGSASVWSVTLDPIWRFHLGGPFGAYLIGGGGFYQRSEDFLVPFQFDVHQTDDAGGVNLGAGLTWHLGWGTKLFVEARYHRIFTPGGDTQIIPITFGLRW